MTLFTEAVQLLKSVVWDGLIFLLLGIGLFYTFATRFLQVRLFGHMFKLMLNSFKSADDGISSFQAYCTSLAGRVGTGNLAGVAIAISLGGPGAVFWMWVAALIGMATGCVESSLAQLYKDPDPDNESFRGGPAYYMEKGLGKRWMGFVFSVLLLICYGFIFNAVQSDSIANAMEEAFAVSQHSYTGIALILVTATVIFGGIRRIAKVAELVVPFMAIAYLLLAFVIVLINIVELPGIIWLVITSALSLSKAVSGVIAYSIVRALIQGTQRGLFSNEAGMGSAPNAAATASVAHPVEQGIIQMFGVFTDTIVICSCTAFIIIISGKYNLQQWGQEGIKLTQVAVKAEIGSLGPLFIAVALFFFAFTSIIANYYYGENCMMFLFSKEKRQQKMILAIYRILVLGVVYLGTVAKSNLVWDMADLFMGLMASVNLIALMLLAPIALKLLRDYDRQLKEHKNPVFDPNTLPEVQRRLHPDVWEG